MSFPLRRKHRSSAPPEREAHIIVRSPGSPIPSDDVTTASPRASSSSDNLSLSSVSHTSSTGFLHSDHSNRQNGQTGSAGPSLGHHSPHTNLNFPQNPQRTHMNTNRSSSGGKTPGVVLKNQHQQRVLELQHKNEQADEDVAILPNSPTSTNMLSNSEGYLAEEFMSMPISESPGIPSNSSSHSLHLRHHDIFSSYPVHISASSSSSNIVKLNVGGIRFTTTAATLLSRGTNFFGPLIEGDFGSLKDETGAYFIDRNGKAFAPILDYLRTGTLTLPHDVKIEVVFEEANFYGVDLLPGICGDIKEGLYTSNNWILFFERDPEHPWIFGITGVEEKTKRVFVQEPCFVKDGSIQWRDHLIYVKNSKVFIWSKSVFKSKTQLYYRTPKSERFPLHLSDALASDRKTPDDEHVYLTFVQTSQGISCRSGRQGNSAPDDPKSKYAPITSKITVLCKSLLIMTVNSEQEWLLYLHSDLAFFTFNHPFMEFSDSFHLIPHK